MPVLLSKMADSRGENLQVDAMMDQMNPPPATVLVLYVRVDFRCCEFQQLTAYLSRQMSMDVHLMAGLALSLAFCFLVPSFSFLEKERYLAALSVIAAGLWYWQAFPGFLIV